MPQFWGGLVRILCWILFLLSASPQVTADSGVYVEFKESDVPGAPVSDRWKLYGASYALVIGIDNYTSGWPRLSNAVKDATLVAEELSRRGFEIELLTDVTGAQMREAFRRFFAFKGKDPQARLFVWFAGHGHSQNGEGYLVPADAPLPGVAEFNYTALHMGDLGSLVRIAQSKHVLAVFDSCFAGTIFTAQRSRPPTAITSAVKHPVRQFLTSGDADQQVADDGTFRTLFLRALNGEEIADANRDGYLTGTELSYHLENRIINLTMGSQTPRGGKLRDPKFDQGDFVFLLPKAKAAPKILAARTAAEPDEGETSQQALELAFWRSIVGSQKASDYEAYLRRFPQGTFEELARSRLDDLEQVTRLRTPAGSEIQVSALYATYVAVKNANLREGPSTATARLGSVVRGQALMVTGKVRDSNWYRVTLENLKEAYIFGGLIAEIDAKELRVWNLARDTELPSHYTTYLELYPNGHFAADAQRFASQYKAASESSSASTTSTETQVALGVFPELPAPGTSFTDCDGCPEMIVVPAGEFSMGSQQEEKGRLVNEGPIRGVAITRPFAIAKHELTRNQWAACVRENGCRDLVGREPWETGLHPVMRVSWSDAQQYVLWLSDKTGKDYRLPTEAEWEYVARAGTATNYWWGEDFGRNNANCKVCGSRWDRKQTAPVGSFKANRFGLHDTAGNLWEWTEDCWHKGFNDAPPDSRAWLEDGNCSYRVIRGGSWLDPPRSLRSAARAQYHTESRHEFIGIRIALTLE